MRSAVTFKGLKQVLAAYNSNEIAPWSIWTGRNMIFTYDGDDIREGASQLKEAFKMLKDGGSEAAYTLKVYKKLPAGEIFSNTPDSGSFSFGLFDYDGEKSPYQQRNNSIVGTLETKMQAMNDALMEKILDKIKEDEEDEEEQKHQQGGLIGFLGKLVDNPDIQQMIMGKINDWLGGSSASRNVGAINGIEPNAQATHVPIDEDQAQKVNKAIEVLAACDPKIGDHLLKVAAIAQNNPTKYAMFTGML